MKIVSRLQCPVAWLLTLAVRCLSGVRVLRPPGARGSWENQNRLPLTRAAWTPWWALQGPCGQPPSHAFCSFILSVPHSHSTCLHVAVSDPPGSALVCPFTLRAGFVERLVRG